MFGLVLGMHAYSGPRNGDTIVKQMVLDGKKLRLH